MEEDQDMEEDQEWDMEEDIEKIENDFYYYLIDYTKRQSQFTK